MEYKHEDMSDFFQDIDVMISLNIHNREVDLFGMDLDIDMSWYFAAEAEGAYKMFTARNDSGRVVGYQGFVIFRHNHHKGSIQAKQDVLYINRNERGFGGSFIKWCDGQLKDLGVEFVHQCVPDKKDWSAILTRMGYTKLETIYLKEL